MSISSKNIRKDLFNSDKTQKPQQKYQKRISLPYDNYSKEITKKLEECCVFKFIRSSEKKETIKTNFSDTEMNYDLCMINKYNEDLNSSLSFISEFDLENDGNEEDNSFNSCDSDNNVEQIEIFGKSSRKNSTKVLDIEHDLKLEKEWNDIQKLLLNKDSS